MSATRALIFDYGNTLVPFGPVEVGRCDAQWSEQLCTHFGDFDRQQFKDLRVAQRMRPYVRVDSQWAESDHADTTQELFIELYGRPPSTEETVILLESRRRSFVDAITAPLDSLATLTALKPHFRLGLVSNFPCGQTIRLSLERTGLIRFLDAVVVSGEIGYVKPHPLPFTLILEQLQVSPAEAVFVGDNWLADVQGAKRAGLRAVWFRRWEPPEDFPAQPGDHEPDHIINEPSALERLFVA